MQISNDHILTTHVGSLPRPPDLFELLTEQDQGQLKDPDLLESRVAQAVNDAVAEQVNSGIDIVSDGEMGKIAYTFYVKHRLSGIQEGKPPGAEVPKAVANLDMLEHPIFAERARQARKGWALEYGRPWVVGPVTYQNVEPIDRDIAHFKNAVSKSKPTEGFLNAASPGVLSKFVPNDYYPNEGAYIEAVADAMKSEYEAIYNAGFLLQIDCPDLGSARHNQYQNLSDDEFLCIANRNMEAVNAATQNIPPDRMRMHICWGNYEGPHTHDFPLAKIFPVLMRARPAAILFEGANPRHEHEWEDIKDTNIPDHKILIPGVLDSTTNFVEHPKLIAQRICNWANVVGRERVIAGTDCGFGTFARAEPFVSPDIVWSKFRCMAEGAQIATDRLWSA